MKTKKLLFSSLLVVSILTFSLHVCLAAPYSFKAKGDQGDGELKSTDNEFGQYSQGDKNFNRGALGGGKRGYEYVLNSSKSPGKRGARGAVDGDPDDGSSKGNTFTTTVLGATMRIGQTYDANFQIFKAYLSFNTSAIPSDAVIKSADLIIYGEGNYGNVNFDIQVVKSVYTDPLWNPDWGAITSGPLATLPVSQFKYYNGVDPDSGKNAIHIEGSNGIFADSLINQGGITKIALVSSKTITAANSTQPEIPGGDEYVTIFSSDATNKALRPALLIDYEGNSPNVKPLLTWIPGDPEYNSKGVSADEVYVGKTNLDFRVRYIYDDGQGGNGVAPTAARLVIDRNNNKIDESADGIDLFFDMQETDPNDTDYSDGKDYQTSAEVTTSGENLGYQFLFTTANGKLADGDPSRINTISAIQESKSSDDSKACFISSTNPMRLDLWLLGIIMSLGLLAIMSFGLKDVKMMWKSEKQ